MFSVSYKILFGSFSLWQLNTCRNLLKRQTPSVSSSWGTKLTSAPSDISNAPPCSAGAYNNILGEQSKNTPNPRTGYRCLCDGKYQEALQSPAYVKILQLIPSNATKLPVKPKSLSVLQQGCGGGWRFQWLQLPLLVQKPSRGGAGRSIQHFPGCSHHLWHCRQQGHNVNWSVTICCVIWWINWTLELISQERAMLVLRGRGLWAEATRLWVGTFVLGRASNWVYFVFQWKMNVERSQRV